jgi:hypothetical protein
MVATAFAVAMTSSVDLPAAQLQARVKNWLLMD